MIVRIRNTRPACLRQTRAGLFAPERRPGARHDVRVRIRIQIDCLADWN